jgi:3-phenylpropionate/trans-cinnamate dioxygenase ferredoxin subunit
MRIREHMVFVKVATKNDLPNGEKIGVKAGGKEIMVVNWNGNYFAINDICTHKGCKLSKGFLMEGSVECPCHGSIFDIKNGKVLNGPAQKPEPAYKTKVQGDEILVDV